jgi:hypothetical protein
MAPQSDGLNPRIAVYEAERPKPYPLGTQRITALPQLESKLLAGRVVRDAVMSETVSTTPVALKPVKIPVAQESRFSEPFFSQKNAIPVSALRKEFPCLPNGNLGMLNGNLRLLLRGSQNGAPAKSGMATGSPPG